MQTSHQFGSNIVSFMPARPAANDDGLSPAVMAQYLREMNPTGARCFALEMHERVAWANESWGAYWAEIARLV